MQNLYNYSLVFPIGCYVATPLSVLPHILAWFQRDLVKTHLINMRNLGSYPVLSSDR